MCVTGAVSVNTQLSTYHAFCTYYIPPLHCLITAPGIQSCSSLTYTFPHNSSTLLLHYSLLTHHPHFLLLYCTMSRRTVPLCCAVLVPRTVHISTQSTPAILHTSPNLLFLASPLTYNTDNAIYVLSLLHSDLINIIIFIPIIPLNYTHSIKHPVTSLFYTALYHLTGQYGQSCVVPISLPPHPSPTSPNRLSLPPH